ncbi:MAG: malate dehydrogenase (quinone) [Saprospiraceae bacterium]
MKKSPHIVLIGAGIMSATLGVLLKHLIPASRIRILERLNKVAAESSDGWNNAGTGHSAFCELNYTPMREGKVDLTKALKIAQQFEESKQLWAHLVESGHLPIDKPCINDLPHMSFVWGEDNVAFLVNRYNTMVDYPIFSDMLYSHDMDEIAHWVPLMMNGRVHAHPMAATRMDIGTDVNFGLLTRGMVDYLESCDGIEVSLGREVEDLTKLSDGRWKVDVKILENCEEDDIIADYVFVGAGGGSLPLLEKSDIPEGRGFGGFPVSGQFLHCTNEDIIKQHEAKVYGKAAVGSPPMSVPHLDTRWIDGKRSLLFGPYAGFSTKFLKEGSYLDLFLSVEMHNVWPMMAAGAQNIPLTKYLIDQVMQSKEERFEFLQNYYPEANIDDWENIVAGQRVQIIKKDKKEGGKLQFGTEVVSAADGSFSALLGASPGASTSVSIMINVLKDMFPDEMKSDDWRKAIKKMIPSYGESLITNGPFCNNVRDRTSRILKLL